MEGIHDEPQGREEEARGGKAAELEVSRLENDSTHHQEPHHEPDHEAPYHSPTARGMSSMHLNPYPYLAARGPQAADAPPTPTATKHDANQQAGPSALSSPSASLRSTSERGPSGMPTPTPQAADAPLASSTSTTSTRMNHNTNAQVDPPAPSPPPALRPTGETDVSEMAASSTLNPTTRLTLLTWLECSYRLLSANGRYYHFTRRARDRRRADELEMREKNIAMAVRNRDIRIVEGRGGGGVEEVEGAAEAEKETERGS